MIQQFITQLRANFYARLERKTGWGKEELKLEFEQAVSETLAKMANGQMSAQLNYSDDYQRCNNG